MKTTNVFIVGHARCGTTFLANELYKNGFKLSTFGKEVTFFDYRIKNQGNLGFDSPEYSRYISSFRGNRKTLDASPWNISEASARQIKYFFPDAKVIICIRDPIDRAVSHFMHNVLRDTEIGKDIYDFENKLSDKIPEYFQESMTSYDYHRHSDFDRTLKNYKKHFSNTNLFLFNIDSFKNINEELSNFLNEKIIIANPENRINSNTNELGTSFARKAYKFLNIDLSLESKNKIKRMLNKGYIFKNYKQIKHDKLKNKFSNLLDSEEFALLQQKYKNIYKN